MKLYIKANTLKILKNIETLLPYKLSKTDALLGSDSKSEYKTNLKSALEIQKHQAQLFYDTRELSKMVKGVYFGNSSCEHLLASIRDIVEAREYCELKHYNFVFVFPALGEKKMEDISQICELLSQKKNSEVVVNDMGVLQRVLEYKNLKPILGLNFTKMIKNAFLDNVSQSDISKQVYENQKDLLSHIEFENTDVREFYKSIGIGRFSVENVSSVNLDFLDAVPRMQIDIYYPYIALSNSRACDIAGCFEDKRGYFAHDECSKYCNFASLEFKHSNILDITQRYNTIYKKNINLAIQKNIYKSAKNRLVWEIFV